MSADRVTAKPGSAGGADGPLLEKREKWRTPNSFVSAFKGKARAVLSALMCHTRLALPDTHGRIRSANLKTVWKMGNRTGRLRIFR
ncbi:MAG: hypothetical protein WA213_21725 [Terriglobales bacterium]